MSRGTWLHGAMIEKEISCRAESMYGQSLSSPLPALSRTEHVKKQRNRPWRRLRL